MGRRRQHGLSAAESADGSIASVSPDRNPGSSRGRRSVTNTFSGLRSRWTIPFSCAAASPLRDLHCVTRSLCRTRSAGDRRCSALAQRLVLRATPRRCIGSSALMLALRRCRESRGCWDGSARLQRALPARIVAAVHDLSQNAGRQNLDRPHRGLGARRARDRPRPCRPRRAVHDFIRAESTPGERDMLW